MKQLEEERNNFKLKALDKNNQRQYRLDLEKSQKKIKKLEEKVRKFEEEKINNKTQLEIQKHIAESMYQDEKKRIEK